MFRLVTKPWQRIAEEKVDGDFKSGALAFHDGSDVGAGGGNNEFWDALVVEHQPIRRVIFLLNVTKVGENAFYYAVNPIVVDIPEVVESIDSLQTLGWGVFYKCSKLVPSNINVNETLNTTPEVVAHLRSI
ncbi:hypothetical protein TrLO_g9463 [Triparma laevis f. longispina]|nr:hypothetical protein TrLO_g9463 [Triparma laevis f. longispina]